MRQVLKKPILSEKSTRLGEQGQYVFEVHPDSNKIEIRKAVEARYHVGVTDVRTVMIHPRVRTRYTRTGYISGKTPRRKKAIVTLRKGQTIDMFGELPPEGQQ